MTVNARASSDMMICMHVVYILALTLLTSSSSLITVTDDSDDDDHISDDDEDDVDDDDTRVYDVLTRIYHTRGAADECSHHRAYTAHIYMLPGVP